MSFIAFFFALEMGFAREGIQFRSYELSEIGPLPYYIMDWCGYTDLEFGALLFEHLRVSGGVRTFIISNPPYFAPFRSVYSINVAYELGWLTVGVEHICDHKTEAGVNRDEIAAFRERAYVRIEVGK